MWGNLKLSKEEDVAIELEDEATMEVQKKGKRCLIGKIWTEQSICKNIVESTMAKTWILSKPATFKEVGPNVFNITLANHLDKN